MENKSIVVKSSNEERAEENYPLLPLVVAFIFVVVIMVYVITIGRIDLQQSIEREKKIDRLQSRHRRYKELVSRRKGLKKKLDRRFSVAYFGTRLILIGLWLGLNCLLANLFNDFSLGAFLNYNEALVIALAVLSFLAFGNLSSLKNWVEKLKITMENRVYGKYIDLDQKIEADEMAMAKIKIGISAVIEKQIE
jgi:type II secretory pathway pseudopilin PulG